jgi:pimeloyl-ACP methyl ester carboxylesterase
MKLTSFSLELPDDACIHGDIRYEEHHNSSPILLIIHGFRGSKNWGFFPVIAEEFAKAGFIAITWNMSLNGYSKDSLFIDKPDDFAHNTITQELADTQAIIDSIVQNDRILSDALRSQWNGEIHVMGHSRGGGIGIMISEKNPIITKLALWNSIARFGRFTERQKKVWAETGLFHVDTMEDGTIISMNYSYIEDLESHGDAYSLILSIAQVKADIILVHAEQDMTVPIREAITLEKQAPSAILHTIPQTGHIFGCTHPFTTMTLPLRNAIDITTTFYRS